MAADPADCPSSAKRFPDGGEYRIEIPSTESARALAVVLEEADKRKVPVHRVSDLTVEGPRVERELALVKVAGKGEVRRESLRIADIFRARVVDSTNTSFVFELTGSAERLNAFIDLMRPLGLREMARTGVAALARGA